MKQLRRLSCLGLGLLAAACAGEGEETTGEGEAALATPAEMKARADEEYSFMMPAFRAYDATVAVMPGIVGLHRTDCSRALVAGLAAPARAAIDAKIPARISAAAAAMADGTIDVPTDRHVILSVAVDCLLASSVLAKHLAERPTDPQAQRAKDALASMANATRVMARNAFGPLDGSGAALWAQTDCLTEREAAAQRRPYDARAWARPACFQRKQRENLGDSQTEELGLVAAFAYLARNLVAVTPAENDALLSRGSWAMSFALAQGDQRVAGTPFPASGLTANHQMRPNPYYSAGALLSLADALAVHRQLDKAGVPVGFPTKERIKGLLGEVNASMNAAKAYTGAYDFVNNDGSARANESERFDDNTIIFAKEEPWSVEKSPFMPADGVGSNAAAGPGTIAQYIHPRTGRIKGYQYNGASVRGFECDPQWMPGVSRCAATHVGTLAAQWRDIQNQGVFGAQTMPTDRVDAVPQWTERDGLIHTRVFKDDKVWDYTCTGATPAVCTAVGTTTIAAHFASLEETGAWNGTAPPTGGVDAATVVSDATGLIRRYYFKGDRIWQERCEPGARCKKFSTSTLQALWRNVEENPATGGLPERDIDAATQFIDANGALHSHVFKGNMSWKYVCKPKCTYAGAMSLADRWSTVIGQERLATVSQVRRGVTDWGLDGKSFFNSAFALAADKELYDDPNARKYDEVRAEQRKASRATNAMLPTAYVPTSATGWVFDAVVPSVAAPTPDGVFSIGGYGATGWWPRAYCALLGGGNAASGWCQPKQRTRRESVHGYYWLNVMSARHHGVAYLLQTPERRIARF